MSRWPQVLPPVALVMLVLTWHRHLPAVVTVVVGLALVGAVLSAVHHAEVVAHKVGEPFGSLVLAVAVTAIEVALIVVLMVTSDKSTEALARDTVFAALMITTNGIVGISLLTATRGRSVAVFHAEGAGSALATVGVLATLCLVLPTFTSGASGPRYTTDQLVFAGIAAAVLYGAFVATQTVRHRDYFLPVVPAGSETDREEGDDAHATPPSAREAWLSVAFLLVALVGVVGLAKTISPSIESSVASMGLPYGFVGVVIALLILAPEAIAAVRAASRGLTQTSLNLSYGSAMASIGLTIPAVALSLVWVDGPLALGLDGTEIVLLAATMVTGVLTVVPGRATALQGAIHLAILAAYLYLAASP